MTLSPYVRWLRTKVGRNLILIPSAAALVFDEDRILLVRNAVSGEWSTPGGAVEPDELPAEAAVRELREETGLVGTPVRLLGVYGGEACRVTYSNGDVVGYVGSAFECRVQGGVARPDGIEISELRFVRVDELERMDLASVGRSILAITARGRRRAAFDWPGGRR